jgi:hypothetical protein
MNERKRACFGTKIKKRYNTVAVVVVVVSKEKDKRRGSILSSFFLPLFLLFDHLSKKIS